MGSLSLTTSQNLNQSGFSGYGSLLTVSKDSDDEFPGSFMGALMQISAVNIRTNVIPSSHMRSKGRFQSFSPGLRDGGDIAAAVNWLPGANDTQARYAADWSLLRQATLESNELTRIRVFAPDPDLHMISMRGFLTQLGPFSYAPEAIMSGQVGWKIVGAPDVITPLVYDVSGASYGTVALNDISKASASGPGGVPSTIRLERKDYSGVGGTNTLGTVSVTHTASDKYSVSLAGVGSDVDVESNGVGDARIRLFIPGVYELWLDHADHTDDAFEYDPTVTTDVTAFHAAYQSNGNKCFLAIYGSDERL